MKDGDMPKIIKEMCAERPEIGARVSCYLYDEIEARAKKSSNIALSCKDLLSNIAGGITKFYSQKRMSRCYLSGHPNFVAQRLIFKTQLLVH